jgi:hypothetical protein
MIVLKLSLAFVFLSLGFATHAHASSVIAIGAGSSATNGNFLSDRDYSGGTVYSSTLPVDTSNVVNPPPQEVFRSMRYGANFGYVIPGLSPGGSFLIRLHMAETYFTAPGSRIFNIAINGTPVVNNFDLITATGGRGIATVREFTASANALGNISIDFSSVVDNAVVSGIEIFSGSSPFPIPNPSYNLILKADQPLYSVGNRATILLTTRNEPKNSNFEFFVSSTFMGVDVPLTRITDGQSYGTTPPLTAGSQLWLANLYLQNRAEAKSLNDAIDFYTSEIARLNLALGNTADPNQIAAIQAEIARDQSLLNSSKAQLVKVRTLVGPPVSLVISAH